jgi:hypothetical protein
MRAPWHAGGRTDLGKPIAKPFLDERLAVGARK